MKIARFFIEYINGDNLALGFEGENREQLANLAYNFGIAHAAPQNVADRFCFVIVSRKTLRRRLAGLLGALYSFRKLPKGRASRSRGTGRRANPTAAKVALWLRRLEAAVSEADCRVIVRSDFYSRHNAADGSLILGEGNLEPQGLFSARCEGE